MAAWVGPPPRPALPPRPWKIVSSIAVRPRHLRERLLGAVDRPLCGEVAAVLPGVGVADHDLETSAALGDTAGVARVREQCLDVSGRSFQVGDRLEEGNDGDRFIGELEHARARLSAFSVAETMTVSSACSPCRARAPGERVEDLPCALDRLPDLARVEPDVELGQMEAEELHAPLELREPPVAMRCPRLASRLRRMTARSASSSAGPVARRAADANR